MSIRIKARSGESVEQMLRRFKKLCEKEGLTKDVKRKMNYEKPSERKRREVRRPPPIELGRPGAATGREGSAGVKAGAKGKSSKTAGGRGMSRGRSE